MNDLIRLSTAAKEVTAEGVHPGTIYRWIRQGKLTGWKVGGALYVRREDVLAMAKPVGVPVKPRTVMRRDTERILREAKIL